MKTPYIIAEIGVNHFDIAKQRNISPMQAAKIFVEEAKKGGAHCAKFQSYKAEKIVSKNSPAYWDTNCEPTKTQYELFKKFDHFEDKDYIEVAKHCESIGIDFLSTPFDLDAVDFLDEVSKFFKVASADVTNYPLLKKIASKGKEIVMSTGASTIGEVEKAIECIYKVNPEIHICLLHCVLSYPTKDENAGLKKITHLKNIFAGEKISIGYSDHTLPSDGMGVCTAAYVMGARVIEKHFTLDKTLQGNDHYHAMNTQDLSVLKDNIDRIDRALLIDEKNYQECEKVPRQQARRSIVLNKDMKKGDIITEEDIIMKRPGTGIGPEFIDFIIGKTLKEDLPDDTILQFKHI